jgi:transcriptional regulator with XRE-family HTH domain
MTQKDLAVAMDVDQAAVSRWETGETKPLRKTHQKLAGILGCTVDELLAPDEAKQ